MYETKQKKEPPPLQMMAEAGITEAAAQKSNTQDPYAGRPLQVSDALAGHIRQSFGIRAKDLSLRESPQVADMGARAVAQGDSIRFAPGEFQPKTKDGMQVLGHELSHVASQATSKVKANIPGSNIHFDGDSEDESDSAGAGFAYGRLRAGRPISPVGASFAPIQGAFVKADKKTRKRMKTALERLQQRSITDAREHYEAQVNPRIAQAKQNNTEYQPLDERVMGIFSRDMDYDRRAQFYENMFGGGENRDQELAGIKERMLERQFTPEMFTRDYVIAHPYEAEALGRELTYLDSLKSKFPEAFADDPLITSLLEIMAPYGQFVNSVQKSVGVDAGGREIDSATSRLFQNDAARQTESTFAGAAQQAAQTFMRARDDALLEKYEAELEQEDTIEEENTAEEGDNAPTVAQTENEEGGREFTNPLFVSKAQREEAEEGDGNAPLENNGPLEAHEDEGDNAQEQLPDVRHGRMLFSGAARIPDASQARRFLGAMGSGGYVRMLAQLDEVNRLFSKEIAADPAGQAGQYQKLKDKMDLLAQTAGAYLGQHSFAVSKQGRRRRHFAQRLFDQAQKDLADLAANEGFKGNLDTPALAARGGRVADILANARSIKLDFIGDKDMAQMAAWRGSNRQGETPKFVRQNEGADMVGGGISRMVKIPNLKEKIDHPELKENTTYYFKRNFETAGYDLNNLDFIPKYYDRVRRKPRLENYGNSEDDARYKTDLAEWAEQHERFENYLSGELASSPEWRWYPPQVKTACMEFMQQRVQGGSHYYSSEVKEVAQKELEFANKDSDLPPELQDVRLRPAIMTGISAGNINLAKRDVAYYRVDQMLGFNLVPQTLLVKDSSGRMGRVMEQFKGIEGGNLFFHSINDANSDVWKTLDPDGKDKEWVAKVEDAMRIITDRTLLKRMSQMLLLDLICGQHDRHQDNFTIFNKEDGSYDIQAFDNDLSFGSKEVGFSGMGKTGGFSEFVSEESAEAVLNLNIGEIRLKLADLLTPDELDGVEWRLEEVKKKINTMKEKDALIPDEDWNDMSDEDVEKFILERKAMGRAAMRPYLMKRIIDFRRKQIAELGRIPETEEEQSAVVKYHNEFENGLPREKWSGSKELV